MRVRNYSEQTVEHRETHLRNFIAWCDERGVTRPQEVTRPVLERYQRYLFLYRKKNGEALSGRSQHMRLVPVKLWFRWLVRQNAFCRTLRPTSTCRAWSGACPSTYSALTRPSEF